MTLTEQTKGAVENLKHVSSELTSSGRIGVVSYIKSTYAFCQY